MSYFHKMWIFSHCIFPWMLKILRLKIFAKTVDKTRQFFKNSLSEYSSQVVWCLRIRQISKFSLIHVSLASQQSTHNICPGGEYGKPSSFATAYSLVSRMSADGDQESVVSSPHWWISHVLQIACGERIAELASGTAFANSSHNFSCQYRNRA